jgi:glycosyltransferase involved in cell wall biosynthesis
MLPLVIALVNEPGQVAALNRGLESASGDVIAITDDDAAPRLDWLERISAAFAADASLGGLGGRDWVHERGGLLDESRRVVGKVLWTGKMIGNHHLGVGKAREVDVLKGANMSYRRTTIGDTRFDTRLRGRGAQIHNDVAFSISVKHAGWKLVYDPSVAVDHFPAVRSDDAGPRDAQTLTAIRDAAYNLHLILREQLPPFRREIAWWWYLLIGTRAYPGVAHALLALLKKPQRAQLSHWSAVRNGAHEARRDVRRGWPERTGHNQVRLSEPVARQSGVTG